LHTQIVCCDTVDWKQQAQSYANAITQDPIAKNYVSVISGHGYSTHPDLALTGTGQKHVWETEWATNDAWNPSWDDGSKSSGFTWAQSISDGLTKANLSAFLYWWGARADDKRNNDALILYHNNTLETSKRLWAFANYSRFVRPAAIRIGATPSNN